MKLTSKQRNDLETIRYFSIDKNTPITDRDIEMFFEHSDKGLHKDLLSSRDQRYTGFYALVEGKRWRGVHMQMYEEGVMDCSMPYCMLLAELKERKFFWLLNLFGRGYRRVKVPRSVVDFMKKEMFKGIDAEIIESCYQSL